MIFPLCLIFHEAAFAIPRLICSLFLLALCSPVYITLFYTDHLSHMLKNCLKNTLSCLTCA